MASTVTTSAQSSTAKTTAPSKDYSFVDNISVLTLQELQHYPFLSKHPDALYWLMSTFGAESGWRLFHGNPASSRHLTAVVPKITSTAGLGPFGSSGTLMGNGYQYWSGIQNLWNAPNVTPQTRTNIMDGWYAHGISACMGTYHVKGCPNNKGEWRARPEAVARIEALGLEVDPGVSITQTLFPTDDDTCRLRSVASGLVIFNSKYRQGLELNGNDPNRAMQFALGAYLGAAGARDANGTSPDDRRRDLSSNQGRIGILKYIGVVRTGDTAVLTSDLIDLSNKEAKAKGASKVVNNPAGGAKTNSGSDGTSASSPGCALN